MVVVSPGARSWYSASVRTLVTHCLCTRDVISRATGESLSACGSCSNERCTRPSHYQHRLRKRCGHARAHARTPSAHLPRLCTRANAVSDLTNGCKSYAAVRSCGDTVVREEKHNVKLSEARLSRRHAKLREALDTLLEVLGT